MYRQQLKAHEILRTLVDVGQFLSVAKVPFETRLAGLMASTAELLTCDRCALYRWNGEVYSDPIAAGVRPDGYVRTHVITRDSALLVQARAADGFLVINQARQHRLMSAFAERVGLESIIISLIDDPNGSPIGFVAAEFHRRGTSFSELDAEVLAGVGILAREAIFSERAHTLARLSEQARRTAHDLVEDAAERERRRIGRDIHDDVLQRVSSLAHFLEVAAGNALSDENRSLLLWLHREARGSAIALRGLVQDLDPLDTETVLLRQVLDGVVASANVRSKAVVTLQVLGDYSTSVAVTTAVHRIVRQAVDNAIEHADANRIDIVLESTDVETLVMVTDDGVGFAIDEVETGIGLLSMSERAARLGGDCVVTSTPGSGALVTARIPQVDDHPPTLM